jgi:hypothetical protein
MNEPITEWASHKTKEFPTWITKTLPIEHQQQKMIQGCDIQTEKLELFPHQEFIRDYMQHKSPYRGILLYHGLGVGKTCAAIAVAEIMNNQRDIIVMLPASLQMNFKNEIMRCGSESFSVNQHWKFVPIPKDETHKSLSEKVNLSSSLIKKFKGYWRVRKSKTDSNFENLNEEQKQQIKVQLNETISKRYQFINYNGISNKKIDEMLVKGNPFDNKLVIIDESHVFISEVMNGKSDTNKRSAKLYRELINAKNIKIVMLSGTPIVNAPVEIAYTLNLLGGMNQIYRIQYSSISFNQHHLEQLEDILHYELKYENGKRYIEFELTPNGFVKNKNNKLIWSPTKKTNDERANDIAIYLEKEGLNIIPNKMKNVTIPFKKLAKEKLFPTDKNEFDNSFIDEKRKITINDEIFMRRMMGLVSFYESSDTSLYPTNLGETNEVLDFSDHQLNKYSSVREQEIKQEKKAKNPSDIQSYKTFSRMLCNFVFPEDIERPKPKRITETDDNMDYDDMEDIDTTDVSKLNSYKNKLKKALHKLEKNKDLYLKEDLGNYSPKYKRIIQNLKKTNGTSIVYSQFRDIEGVGILGIALKAHGYAEMKVSVDKNNNIDIDVDEEDYMKPKFATFSTDKEVSNVILKIFNSDLTSLPKDTQEKLKLMDVEKTNDGNLRGSLIKILMITQSGSAGISLKNVRQVHILEPYWNKTRIDQVIGRANRTCSHISLPPRERNFETFMYRMKIDQSKKENIAKLISAYDRINYDDGTRSDVKSTDELIYNLSLQKDKIISKVLLNLRKASVDCALHKSTINQNTECFAFPFDSIGFEKTYNAKYIDDINKSNELKKISKITVKPLKVIIDKKEYIWIQNQNNNELFDFKLYKRSGVLDKVGTLEKMKDGWYKLTLPKSTRKMKISLSE